MIKLHKASAGSGKTYTLAREYLEYMLTVRNPETGEVRLRTIPELEDSVGHILAVTFTNKATAEMKQRIVERLDDLANSPKADKDIDYLDYFLKMLNVEKSEFRTTAKAALSILLNDYTDFQVSTIDSFFQTILRTFAYEIDLNDNYELELDSELVAKSAIDATLSDVNSAAGDRRIDNLLVELMSSEMNSGKTWNIFKKQKHGVYDNFFNAVKKMSSEDFAEHRATIDAFFAGHPNPEKDFRELSRHFESGLKELYVQARSLAIEVANAIPRHSEVQSYLPGRCQKIIAATPYGLKDKTTKLPWSGKAFSGKVKKLTTDEQIAFSELVVQFYEAVKEWHAYMQSASYRLWEIYKKNLRLLPLMHITATRSEELLRQQNTVQLADTNTILRKVIGNDDTPFIYERLSSRLNHYLIDEFQDTSKLQWENFRPLLDESESHNFHNLIIGDAKQSIYRFRNADSSLIVSGVAADYPGRITLGGLTAAENTNHRTSKDIVFFNNTFFTRFAADLDADFKSIDELPASYAHGYFKELYAQVCQQAAKDNQGYVEFRLIGREDSVGTPAEVDESGTPIIPPGGIGCLIAELHRRGYAYGDIALLVRTNKEAKAVVSRLIEYNNAFRQEPIDFISEEALMIRNASSVRTILSVLQLIAGGPASITRGKQDCEEGEKAAGAQKKHKRLHIPIDLFNCRYQLLALNHPDMEPGQLLEEFYKENSFDLEPMLRSLQSMAIPALIETIVCKFLSDEVRASEAPYIAAFQDLALDYCDSNPSDVASFLKWWKIKSEKAGIASPEGLDAVRIMTIHKAKGLEFECVIIPSISGKNSPKSGSWSWVKPDKKALGLPAELADTLPEILPVEISSQLVGTPHSEVYFDEIQAYRMDMINTWYVAFTRPVSELYVFVDEGQPITVASGMRNRLKDISQQEDAGNPLLIDGSDLRTDLDERGNGTVSYGAPLSDKQIKDIYQKRHRKKLEKAAPAAEQTTTTDDTVGSYDSNIPDHKFLHFREQNISCYPDEDSDPRSRGNRIHDILSEVIVASDLERSVRRRVIRGVLSESEGRQIQENIAVKLASPRVAQWFRPGLRVINERTLLRAGSKMKRPDRIIVDADGNATVIDYKCGNVKERRHHTQVAEYVSRLRDSGSFASVEGYLWYVELDIIEAV